MRTICAFLILCFPGALFADHEGPHKPGPHKPLDTASKVLPWQAVGRLDFGGGAFCTGTLIAHQLVLTAGHCVYRFGSGALLDAENITFRAGFRHGRSAAIRRAKRFVVHPDYTYENGRNTLADVAVDVAVIELERPINDAAIRPFPRHRKPVPDQKVTVVSYAQGRARVPSIEEGCKMTHSLAEVLHYTCDIDLGSSGAPIFVTTNQGPKIASIISSSRDGAGRRTALGVGMGPAVDKLVRLLKTSKAKSRFQKVRSGGINAQLGRSDATLETGLPQIK